MRLRSMAVAAVAAGLMLAGGGIAAADGSADLSDTADDVVTLVNPDSTGSTATTDVQESISSAANQVGD